MESRGIEISANLNRLRTKSFGCRILASQCHHLIHQDGMHLAVNLVTFISLRQLETHFGSFSYFVLILVICFLCGLIEETFKEWYYGQASALYFSIGFSGINCALEVIGCVIIPVGYFFGFGQPRIYDLIGKLAIAHLADRNSCFLGHGAGLGVGGFLLALINGVW